MGFTIRQDKEEVAAAHRFQVNAELRDVQLLDCLVSTSEGKAQLEDRLRLRMTTDPSVLHVAEGQAKIAVRISVFGDPDDAADETDSHLFQVVCRYALLYDLRPGYVPAQRDLDAFKDGNAIFHCWPYTRELVQSMTMRMGLPVPPLPFLRLVPKPEPKKVPVKRQATLAAATKSEKAGD
jgi:hypothetical protein